MTDHQHSAVLDALHEAAITRPEIAAPFSAHYVKASALREAFAFIPNEHHRPGATIGERFVASVIANAVAAGRSPYTIALFALDIA